jgi:hypothetical protein
MRILNAKYWFQIRLYRETVKFWAQFYQNGNGHIFWPKRGNWSPRAVLRSSRAGASFKHTYSGFWEMHGIQVGVWSRTFESISPIIAQISQKWPYFSTLEALKSMFTELIRQIWDLINDQEIKGYRMSHSCLRRLSTHFESSYSILRIGNIALGVSN